MANVNLLMSKMVLYGDTNFVKCLSDLLSISRNTASKKLKGLSNFSDEEIRLIAANYYLTADDIEKIFVKGE